MRLILEITCGFYKGQKLWLREGQVLQIGRTEDADLALPQDSSLSSLHFAAECQFDACRVRDLNSRNGLFVNGARVSEAVLADGDEVTAGATRFNVRLEGLPKAIVSPPSDSHPSTAEATIGCVKPDTDAIPTLDESTIVARPRPEADSQWHAPPPHESVYRGEFPRPPADPRRTKTNVDVTVVIPVAPAAPTIDAQAIKPTLRSNPPVLESAAPTTPAATHSLVRESSERILDLRHYRPEDGNVLFAVVDGASALKLVHHARRLELRTESLLAGDLSPALAAVAPYLVEVTPDCGFLDLWGEYVGKNPGILLESSSEFEAVLAHARKIFLAVDDRGHENFFRFYDPRVIRAHLPTCSVEELSQFFGPISHLAVESDDPQQAIRFSAGPAGVMQQTNKHSKSPS